MESVSSASAVPLRKVLLPVAVLAGALATGAAIWLWMQHGVAVYATQIATFAWNCF